MAKRVADVSSITNSLSSQAISNVNSKISKLVGKKGGARIARLKRRELNDTTNKKSPRPAASSKEDINIEGVIPSHDHSECIEEEGHDYNKWIEKGYDCKKWIDKGHDHNKCIEEEKAAQEMWMMLALQNKFSRKRESPQDDCISILEQKKESQCSSPESIEPEIFSGWVDYTMEGSSPPPTP